MQTVVEANGYTGRDCAGRLTPKPTLLTGLQAPSEAEAQCAELARGEKVPLSMLFPLSYISMNRYTLLGQKTWIP